MKELLLITFANKVYRDKLESKGYRVIEFSQPLRHDSLDEMGADFKGTAVIEFIEDTMKELEDLIDDLRKNSVRIVAITAKINNTFRDYFFKHGIAEVLESNSSSRIAGYIDITDKDANKRYGKILILEDSPQRINIFETIIGRFNFTPIIAQKVDKFFEYTSEGNIQLMFVNLGAGDLEISDFLRRFLAEVNKNIPVIPYKDIKQGLFIHEMISGLNKIAKIILSTDEAYSFLVDILFRKELSPGLNLLNETLDFNSLNRFAVEPLSRIYSIMGIDIFKMNRIITKDNIDIINGRIESLKNLIIKVDGLRWLIRDDIGETRA